LLYSDEYTEKIEFKIEDTGIGIADYEIDKIFGSFMQGDLSAKKKYMGTGLGLTISKKLALLMDGDIYVESKLGKGSCFRFVCTLPKLKIQPKEMKTPEEDQTTSESIYPADKSIESNVVRNEIILSVEDNEINQEVVEALVRNSGFHLLNAYNGEEALKLLDKYQVDLILMDVQMPVINGYDLTRMIRSMDRYRNIPIIAMTAYAMEADRNRCLEAGMNDFIPKPIGFDYFYNIINKYLK
jgi:CheY-like chemotaxis protein